jgi:hypothetical protein
MKATVGAKFRQMRSRDKTGQATIGGSGIRQATPRDLANFLVEFGKAQKAQKDQKDLNTSGDPCVIVRNLLGMEPMCAALAFTFGADIRVGGGEGRQRMASGIKRTRVQFEFDDGPPSVGVRMPGGAMTKNIVDDPSWLAPRAASSEVIYVLRKDALDRVDDAGMSVRLIGAIAAYHGRKVAGDLVETAKVCRTLLR